MRTNTNQIHKNRSTARTAPQIKIHRNPQPPAVNGAPARAEETGTEDGTAVTPAAGASLSFYDQIEDGFIASVPIGKERLARLKRRAADSGGSLGGFVRQYLDRALAELEGRCDIRGKAEDVDEAVAQSVVLMELIEHHLDYREHRSGKDWTGDKADQFNFGLEMLMNATRERLKAATDAIMDAAYHKELKAVAS